jgi:hypothetical protein
MPYVRSGSEIAPKGKTLVALLVVFTFTYENPISSLYN